MTIEIDLELLKTTNLTPNEFIGLYLKLRKGYSYLDELTLNIDWKNLEDKGYINYDNSLVTDKFKKVVGNKLHVHNKIIKLLKVQLKMQEDNLGYLQNLETWINNHTWEKYENINENDGRKTTKRITRSL